MDASVDAGSGIDADASDPTSARDATPGDDAQVYGKPMQCVSGLPPDMARLDTTIDRVPPVPGGGGPDGALAAVVSRDGMTVAGFFITDAHTHLGRWFRWSGNDFVDLAVVGQLVGGAPTAIDCTGDTIAGHMMPFVTSSTGEMVFGTAHVVRWRKGEGFHELAPTYAADPLIRAFATAITADGEIVLGSVGDSFRLARWISNGPPDTVRVGSVFAGASTVTFDAEGRVLLGIDGDRATLWRSGQPVVRITDADTLSTTAGAISAGGDYVVGTQMLSSGASKGYLWSAKTGIVHIGDYLIPKAVSATGTVVVGVAPPGGGADSDFIWDKVHGARSLESVLLGYNLHLPAGFRIFELTGVSDDGRVVVGDAVNSSATQAVFRVVLPKAAIE